MTEDEFRAKAQGIAEQARTLRDAIDGLFKETKEDAQKRFNSKPIKLQMEARHIVSNIGSACLERAILAAKETADELEGWARHRGKYDYELKPQPEPEKINAKANAGGHAIPTN